MLNNNTPIAQRLGFPEYAKMLSSLKVTCRWSRAYAVCVVLNCALCYHRKRRNGRNRLRPWSTLNGWRDISGHCQSGLCVSPFFRSKAGFQGPRISSTASDV